MLELHEFFIEGGDQKRSHVLLHITEPSDENSLELEKGYFFALAEVNNGSEEQIEHLQNMIDDLESGYYETDDEADKSSFELTLEHINKRGHHILQDKHSVLNCVVGVICKNKISFSYHGSPLIKMIYKKNDKLELLNVIDGEELGAQLFSAMMQGNLNDDDFFFLATPHVGDNISNDQIINTLSVRSPQQSAQYIEKILGSLKDKISFGGIIIHMLTKQNSPKTQTTSLKKAEKKSHQAEAAKTNHQPSNLYEKEPITNVILITIGRSIISGLVGVFNILKKILIFLGKLLLGLFLLITNKGGQRATVIQSMEDSLNNKKTYLRELPLISKILFVLTMVLAIIFIGSIGYLRIKENVEASQQEYKNKVQAIIDKKTAAEASMIYDDDTKAFNLLKEANALVETLPSKSQEQEDTKKTLEQEIKENLKILQKLNTVESELVIDLSDAQSSAQVSKLALINDTLIAYGPDDLFNYIFNLNTEQLEKKGHQSIEGLVAASTPKEQDKIVFLTKNNEIAEYNPESNILSSKEITLNNGASLSNIFVYSQRLYTIDTANNQIYKHNKIQTGYDKGSAWIKDNTADLSDAVSMSIDGDLFLLKQTGKILKFVNGNRQDFEITGLDPDLDNPTSIWTYNNVENIYILEPTNKRVVVLNKQGKLLQQYTSNSWQNPTDMIVDEGKKVIYILDNNKIYRFGIE